MGTRQTNTFTSSSIIVCSLLTKSKWESVIPQLFIYGPGNWMCFSHMQQAVAHVLLEELILWGGGARSVLPIQTPGSI